jgi:uroporphyrinogen decarboxylase
MTGKERMTNILKRKPVDRIGLFEHFWDDTQREWAQKGQVSESDNFADLFQLDMDECWAFNMEADLNKVPEVVEETEETILIRDGNGALLRRHKLHDSTPEHVDFLVKDRSGWLKHIKPLLTADPARLDVESYRKTKEACRKADRFFCWSGVNVFELMHPVCGHEYMLMGMALDPDWVKDMVQTYSELVIQLWEILFSQEGYPDGIWFYEDMGFKDRPFMSPAMYREIIQSAHKRTIAWAHDKGLPVIMHSCGFVEPLLPDMVEAGIDCLQVIEVKAGMDPIRIHKQYKDVLSLMGGIDVRALYSNDRNIIDKELDSKIPLLKEGYGYALHSDHSIPNTVDVETYRYFIEKGLELGRY